MGEMGVNPEKMINDIYNALKITTSRSKETNASRVMSLGERESHWKVGVEILFLK